MFFRIMLGLFVVMSLAVPVRAGQSGPVVLASLDATLLMGRALCQGTSIHVERAVPAGYSMQGHAAYCKRHFPELRERAEKAEAVLSIASAWPEDPLYPWARRANIRIVHIDAARPLDGSGVGVPLFSVQGRVSPFAWRGPAGMARMAAIAAADLERLFPGQRDRIRRNLESLQATLFALRTRYEMAFAESESVTVAAMTPNFGYLMDGFGLDVIGCFSRPEQDWTSEQGDAFAEELRENGVKAVVCAWEPGGVPLQAMRRAGAVPVVPETFHDGGDAAERLIADTFERNLEKLRRALQ